jgi:hypothetical protein
MGKLNLTKTSSSFAIALWDAQKAARPYVSVINSEHRNE